MYSTIEQLIARHGLPDGYQRLPWADATDDMTVWLWGTNHQNGNNRPWAYGPFTVKSAKQHRLTNKRGNTFMHCSEELLCLTTSKTNSGHSISANTDGPNAGVPKASAPERAPRSTS